jgi:acyl-CoA thioesterase
MDQCLEALEKQFCEEPYAKIFGIEIVELEAGHAILMMLTSAKMNNLLGAIHGAAIFSLVDATFELTVNSHGTIAVALSVNMNYINAPLPGEILQAEGREINRSRKISACQISVTGEDGRLIATCQTLAYRKKDKLPFL